MKKQPESAAHGDAWKFFLKEMVGRHYGDEETRDSWLWFLAGWKSKAKQRVDLRCKEKQVISV